MWPRFGIKIGNSTLCIAYVKADGKVEVIANKQGDRVSQACLLWNGAEEIECGLTAKQKMAARPKQAVANSFQLLKLPQDIGVDDFLELEQIPCKYDKENHSFQLDATTMTDDDDNTKTTTRQMSPYDVQVQLFRAELELARQYHVDPQEKPIVVLAIPSYYPTTAWPLLAKAAETAGFHVAQVICEPTAAVLAYGIGELPETAANSCENGTATTSQYVVTIKSGGMFSHFALYEVRNGLYMQLTSNGPHRIGGRHYTEALVQFICDEFQRKHKLDPHESRRSMAKIRTAAANCKHILSTLPSTQVYIDSLMDGVDFNAQMSRARFESLIQPVLSNFMQTLGEWIEGALQQHPKVIQLDSILLLGATMQIPKLQAVIGARFPEVKLHTSLSADEVVAIGCARQAMFLSDPFAQDLLATAECICADADILIWHGENEDNAQLLLKKSTVLPSIVRVDVKANGTPSENVNADSNNDIDADTDTHTESFWVRSGDQVRKVFLEGAMTAEGDVYRIEANISVRDIDDDDEESEGGVATPVVRLRCL